MRQLGRALVGGAIAGLVSGLFIGLVGRLLGTPLPVPWLAHAGVSLVWGAAFGLLFDGYSATVTVGGGLAWGVVVWLLMVHVLVPLAGLQRLIAQLPPGRLLGAHLAFGLVVAFAYLPFQSERPWRQPRGPAEEPL